MKRMEFIKVQTGAQNETGKRAMLEIAAKLKETPGLERVEVYVNTSYSSDIAMLLQWETETGGYGIHGSSVGLKTVETLKDIGFTSHSVWITEDE